MQGLALECQKAVVPTEVRHFEVGAPKNYHKFESIQYLQMNGIKSKQNHQCQSKA